MNLIDELERVKKQKVSNKEKLQKYLKRMLDYVKAEDKEEFKTHGNLLSTIRFVDDTWKVFADRYGYWDGMYEYIMTAFAGDKSDDFAKILGWKGECK